MTTTIDRPKERWVQSKNPHRLIEIVKQQGIESQRKFRLVAAACCRRVWSMLSAEEQRALEVVERYADDRARYNEMRLAVQGLRIAGDRVQPLLVEAAHRDAWAGLKHVIYVILGVLWRGRSNDLEEMGKGPRGRYWKKADEWEKECALLCHVIRDSFGDIFQPVSLLPPWRTATVLDLAQAAYERRDLPAGTLEPARLAILADALEDAGCDNQVILEHLRGPGPHVPGCWAVDLLLAKE